MSASFTTDRMLRFGDCDISGTAYYPAYMNILNGVIEEFWSVIGWPWGTPTVHLSCDFSKPSLFGEKLTFRLYVMKVGKSSLRLRHIILFEEEVRWTGEQVLAASWLDKHTSMLWPIDVKTKLESLVVPVELLPVIPRG